MFCLFGGDGKTVSACQITAGNIARSHFLRVGLGLSHMQPKEKYHLHFLHLISPLFQMCEERKHEESSSVGCVFKGLI